MSDQEIVRYSMNLEIHHMKRKADKSGDDYEKVFQREIRYQISSILTSLARAYCDSKVHRDEEGNLSLVVNDDLPIPPLELIISLRNNHWDYDVIARMIQTDEGEK